MFAKVYKYKNDIKKGNISHYKENPFSRIKYMEL